ncbi:hypothetical protein D3C85_1836810 [compost metagenome]
MPLVNRKIALKLFTLPANIPIRIGDKENITLGNVIILNFWKADAPSTSAA